MKTICALRFNFFGGVCLGLALALIGPWLIQPHPVQAQEKPALKPTDPVALAAELTLLKGSLPDQSHAMADVAYHFSNLWFAGQKQNWPLAKFYLDETRSHLNWAVRLKPIRKNNAGQEVDLKGILQAVDGTLLSEVKKAIETRNGELFITAYKQTLEGCYSCHKASDKPYLRPQIPAEPAVSIINFDPDARWPQ